MKELILIITLMMLFISTSIFALDLNVKNYGAVANGKTDCTKAFQTALDKAFKAGGGKVKVPFGTYLIKGNLKIPYNVTLLGDWEAPPAPTKLHPKNLTVLGDENLVNAKEALIAGTVLLATAGEGDENGIPFIEMSRNATLKGVIIHYPNQVYDKDPIPYPWTVRGIGDNISIIDCLFVNPYMAVDFGTNPAGRHLIRNLYAQAIYKGLFIDKCYDVGRLENVHFWPFWSAHVLTGNSTKTLDDWTLKNGTAFIFSRSDWEYVSNCFAISYYIGMHFKTSAPDGAGNYLLSQSGSDGCDIAAYVEEAQAHAGISFSNSQMFGKIIIGPKNHAPVRFSSCGFFGTQVEKDPADTETILIQGGANVTFNNCHFYAINGRTNVPVYIRQERNNLTVTNNLFMMNDFLDPIPLVIEEGAHSTIFAQNTIWSHKKVVNNKKEPSERIIIKDNIYADTK